MNSHFSQTANWKEVVHALSIAPAFLSANAPQCDSIAKLGSNTFSFYLFNTGALIYRGRFCVRLIRLFLFLKTPVSIYVFRC